MSKLDELDIVPRGSFSLVSELKPGHSWQRLDGQIITIGPRRKTEIEPRPPIVGYEDITRMDGQKLRVPIRKQKL